MTLIELLVCLACIAVVAGLLLPTISKAARRSRATIWGVEAFHNLRLESVDNDSLFGILSTSKPAPWVFIEWRGTNWYVWR